MLLELGDLPAASKTLAAASEGLQRVGDPVFGERFAYVSAVCEWLRGDANAAREALTRASPGGSSASADGSLPEIVAASGAVDALRRARAEARSTTAEEEALRRALSAPPSGPSGFLNRRLSGVVRRAADIESEAPLFVRVYSPSRTPGDYTLSAR